MKQYDLVVLGAGSGNMLLGPELAHLRTAIVEPERFGGTCQNRGCIPSKMFVVAADAAIGVDEASRLGVHATVESIDWKAIRDRVFNRIDPLHESAVDYRRGSGVDVYTREARFVGPKVIEVGSGTTAEQITGETIVVATGTRPVVPAIDGLADVDFHTSDTIMRLDEVPESLIIVGDPGEVFADVPGRAEGGPSAYAAAVASRANDVSSSSAETTGRRGSPTGWVTADQS